MAVDEGTQLNTRGGIFPYSKTDMPGMILAMRLKLKRELPFLIDFLCCDGNGNLPTW